MIKAVSFDFWNTIATPNKHYSAARSAYIAELFGTTPQHAAIMYTAVKSKFDQEAEWWGKAYHSLACIKYMIAGHDLSRSINATQIFFELMELVKQHPPHISQNMVATLTQLATKLPIGITSNTNFIPGRILRTYLPDCISSHVYSDEIGASKPSRDIFQYTLNELSKSSHTPLLAYEILHVGDHHKCDIVGATRFGMDAALTAQPAATVRIIDNLIYMGRPF